MTEHALEKFSHSSEGWQSEIKVSVGLGPSEGHEAESVLCFFFQSQLTGQDSDAGKDWRQEEKGMTEDKMVGWHHQLKEHELEQALGDDEAQGSLLCLSSQGP